MSALRKLEFQNSEVSARFILPAKDREILNRLRIAALRCRAAARLDLFRACALLGAEKMADAPAFADALLRTLEQGLPRRPVFYAPRSEELSFDESWLMSLIAALRDDDMGSATFLINSRIAPQARRSLGFLAAGLARGLETV